MKVLLLLLLLAVVGASSNIPVRHHHHYEDDNDSDAFVETFGQGDDGRDFGLGLSVRRAKLHERPSGRQTRPRRSNSAPPSTTSTTASVKKLLYKKPSPLSASSKKLSRLSDFVNDKLTRGDNELTSKELKLRQTIAQVAARQAQINKAFEEWTMEATVYPMSESQFALRGSYKLSMYQKTDPDKAKSKLEVETFYVDKDGLEVRDVTKGNYLITYERNPKAKKVEDRKKEKPIRCNYHTSSFQLRKGVRRSAPPKVVPKPKKVGEELPPHLPKVAQVCPGCVLVIEFMYGGRLFNALCEELPNGVVSPPRYMISRDTFIEVRTFKPGYHMQVHSINPEKSPLCTPPDQGKSIQMDNIADDIVNDPPAVVRQPAATATASSSSRSRSRRASFLEIHDEDHDEDELLLPSTAPVTNEEAAMWLEEHETLANGRCHQKSIGDGYCDEACNNKENKFDGGDCCPGTCVGSKYACGTNGYKCLQRGKPCLFLHGLGQAGPHPGIFRENKQPPASQDAWFLKQYWGNMHEELKGLCDQYIYNFAETRQRGWDDKELQRNYYDKALEVYKQGGQVICHSMANMILAAACMDQNLCEVRWIDLAGPVRGSKAAGTNKAIKKIFGKKMSGSDTIALEYRSLGKARVMRDDMSEVVYQKKLVRAVACGTSGFGSGHQTGLGLSLVKTFVYGPWVCNKRGFLGICTDFSDNPADGFVHHEECALFGYEPQGKTKYGYLTGVKSSSDFKQRTFLYDGNHQDITMVYGNHNNIGDFLRYHIQNTP